MPCPKTIKVVAHTYKVIRETREFMGEDLGRCDFNENIIYIVKGLRKDKLREVLTHEILHAVSYPGLVGKTVDDETFVDGMASNLVQTIKDNPEWVEFLTKEDLCRIKVGPKKNGRTRRKEQKP